MNWPWTLLKAAATGVNFAAKRIPLHPAPRTRRVRFADVPVGKCFLYGAGDEYRKVSHDEAVAVGDVGSANPQARYPFTDLDQPVDLVLQKPTL